MKSRTIIAAALAATVLLAGCAKKQEAPKEEPKAAAAPVVDLAAEEQAVRNRSGEWMNYANSKDVASIANGIFASDGILISDEKGAPRNGRDSGRPGRASQEDAGCARQLDLGQDPRRRFRRTCLLNSAASRLTRTAKARNPRTRAHSPRPGPRSTASGASPRMRVETTLEAAKP